MTSVLLLPPRTRFAAGLLILAGGLLLLAAGADAYFAPPPDPAGGFRTDRGYEEGGGSDGYHFRYFLTGTGPGAERTVYRILGAWAGFGFLTFGLRLVRGSAETLLPAAAFAVLVGVGTGYASALAARSGRATVGLPGMGLGFLLVLAAGLLVAGIREYRTYRKVHPLPRRPANRKGILAGGLLIVYGLAAAGDAVYRLGSSLTTVRGKPNVLGLRAEVSVSTGIEPVGKFLTTAAEKGGLFSQGPGYFLHPLGVEAAWGAVWFAVGLASVRGRGPAPRGVAAAAGLGAAAVAVFAGLSLVTSLPWYTALPDGLFPGSLFLFLPAVLLATAPSGRNKEY